MTEWTTQLTLRGGALASIMVGHDDADALEVSAAEWEDFLAAVHEAHGSVMKLRGTAAAAAVPPAAAAIIATRALKRSAPGETGRARVPTLGATQRQVLQLLHMATKLTVGEMSGRVRTRDSKPVLRNKLRAALRHLQQKGLAEVNGDGRTWLITPEGRAQLKMRGLV